MAAQKTHDMFITGRFQIIPDTLKVVVRSLNLDVNALYDNVMRGRIFEQYIINIKRKPIINYLERNRSVEEAAYAWALKCASAGVQKGREISCDPNEYERDADGNIKLGDRNRKIHKPRWAQENGVSYYSDDGLNKAHIMPDVMIRIL